MSFKAGSQDDFVGVWFQDTAPAFVVFARILVPRVGVEPHSSPTRMGYSGLELSNMYVSVRSYHGFVVNALITRCMPGAVRKRTTLARTYRALAGISRSKVDRDVAPSTLHCHFSAVPGLHKSQFRNSSSQPHTIKGGVIIHNKLVRRET